MKEVQLKGYMCEKCGKIHLNKDAAELCCKQYYCEECGVETERYYLLCPTCAEKRNYEKATKMTYKEYIEKYPDYPIFDRNEEDCEWDIEYLIEKYDKEDTPKYFYGATKERVEVDIEYAIQCAEEELPEDGYLYGTQELYDFVKKWNEKYGENVYYCDKKTLILVDDELINSLFAKED